MRSEIYFPFPSQFNDPFDCSFAPNFHEVEDSEIPVILDWLAQRSGTPVEQLRAQLAMEGKEEFLGKINAGVLSGFLESISNVRDGRGIACFAERFNHPLMWAHYSDGHRGICLEFDSSLHPFNQARQVNYQREKPFLRISEVLSEPIKNNSALMAYCTKLPEWEYESEWRILHSKGNVCEAYEERALTGVYLGAVIKEKDVELIIRLVEGRKFKPKIYRGRTCREQLALRFEKI
ncbi:MAG: DUF2971 domain-containing protein [Planctomycetes bacterium]|nr:DUF2971 domain-containing protein [Planctomycetota bacterium]